MNKYGEPWHYHGGLIREDDGMPITEPAHDERAIACVNALAGVDDPERFIAAVRRLVAAGQLIQAGERGGYTMGAVSSATYAVRDALGDAA